MSSCNCTGQCRKTGSCPSGLTYTHPADLTDEEIWEIVQEQYGHSCGLYGNHIGFARAILRKAGEK